MSNISVTKINVHQKTRTLDIAFSDQSEYQLSCEYLRVFSNSAEVKAAKNRGEVIMGKQDVTISNVEAMGTYAIRIIFDDGHDTGIYSWDTLKKLGDNYETNWQQYQNDIKNALQKNQANTIDILLFIDLVTILGTEKVTLDYDEKLITVNDVLKQLHKKGELWQKNLQPDLMQITINKQFSNAEQKIFAGDEIGLVPKAK